MRTIGDAIGAGLVDPAGVSVAPDVLLRSFVEFTPDGDSLFVARGWGVRRYSTATVQ